LDEKTEMFLDEELMELETTIVWHERDALESEVFPRRIMKSLRRRSRRHDRDSFARLV
jgi:hypothetical protein